MINSFLALAYGLLWLIFVVYAVIIHRRQRRLEQELEKLKDNLAGRDGGGSPNP